MQATLSATKTTDNNGSDIALGSACVCTDGAGNKLNEGKIYFRLKATLASLETGEEVAVGGNMRFRALSPGDQVVLTQV